MLNAAMIGSQIGAGLNGIIGGIRSITGSSSARKAIEAQYNANLALQQQAQAWNEKVYKNRYQWQSQDLEKAGISKLFGLGSAPMPTSGQGSVGMPDVVGEKNGRMQNAIAQVGLAQDWSAKKAMIEKTNAETATEKVNTELKAFETLNSSIDALTKSKQYEYLEPRLKQEIENLKVQALKSLSDISVNNSQIGLNNSAAAYNMSGVVLNKEQARNARTLNNQINATTGKINQETFNLNQQIQDIKRKNEFFKKNPGVAKVLTALEAMSDSANTVNTMSSTINNTRGTSSKLKTEKNARKYQKYETTGKIIGGIARGLVTKGL